MDRIARPAGTPLGLGNCGLVAIAAATGYSYTHVEQWFRNERPGRNGNWQGSTRTYEYPLFFGRHGVDADRMESVHYSSPLIPRRMSLKRWATVYAKPGVLYLVVTTGHVQVVRDQHVLDQSVQEPVHVSQAVWRNKLVKHVIKINPQSRSVAMKTYSNRSNAMRAARKYCRENKAAKGLKAQDLEYKQTDDGRWYFELPAKAPTDKKPEAPAKPKQPKEKVPGQYALPPSTVESPVAYCWGLYDKLANEGDVVRKAFVAEAIGAGVNPTTAGCQYNAWRKSRGH